MDVCIIGTGYVGLVTGACLAGMGNTVICVDKDKEKIRLLKEGVIPIYEPGLEALAERNAGEGRLLFTADAGYGVGRSRVVFITVGTPSLPDGDVDLSAVVEAAGDIGKYIKEYTVVVNKSTVPVGTQKMVKEIIREMSGGRVPFDVVSNPEFLREGSAVEDTLHPDRIVVGAENEKASSVLLELYRDFDCPVVLTDPETAEMIKYASNAFLAVKISFINEIANICERVGADVVEVAGGMGLDSRISPRFLRAGIGYGGSCFPKDTAALVKMGEKEGYNFRILKSAVEVNRLQRFRAVEKLERALGRIEGCTVAVLGLSFKPGTGDMREAPSIDIIRSILEKGGTVKAWDPAAVDSAGKILKGVEYCRDVYSALEGADAAVLVTEWDHLKEMDLVRAKGLMRRPVFIDGRNMFDPGKMIEMGFEYYCIGRRDFDRLKGDKK